MGEYRSDQKDAVGGTLSWRTDVAPVRKDNNDCIAKAIVSTGGMSGRLSSAEQKESISKKVSELCKETWDIVLRNHDALILRSQLHRYNFASNPLHWDSIETIRGRIIDACEANKQNADDIPYEQISKDVLQKLADMMTRDSNLILNLKIIKDSFEERKNTPEVEETERLVAADVLKAMGDLERRTGKLEEAEMHYREAEDVYRRIHEDLGLANVLMAMGDLELRTDKLEEAEIHYREAMNLYRKVYDDLGLANVYQSMGDLLQRKKEYCQAIEPYKEAVTLYKKIMDNMGLVYSSAELCYCYMKVGESEKAFSYAQQVINLCKNSPYENVKSYCIWKIKNAISNLK